MKTLQMPFGDFLDSVSQSQGFDRDQDTHLTHMIRDNTPHLAMIGCR